MIKMHDHRFIVAPNCKKCGRLMHRAVYFENGPSYPQNLSDYKTLEYWSCSCWERLSNDRRTET
jgi:hypothetical protein